MITAPTTWEELEMRVVTDPNWSDMRTNEERATEVERKIAAGELSKLYDPADR